MFYLLIDLYSYFYFYIFVLYLFISNKKQNNNNNNNRNFFIPDVKLRKKVRDMNKSNVVPAYSKFYNDYWKTPFTENLHKYVKYTPQSLEEVLEQFFEGTKGNAEVLSMKKKGLLRFKR